MNTLTPEQFRDALRKGLGRAVQHVRNSPPEVVREDLLYACLNNLAYDRQSEYSRAPWLFEMIQWSSEIEFYRREIFEAWFNFTDEPLSTWEHRQLYQLLVSCDS